MVALGRYCTVSVTVVLRCTEFELPVTVTVYMPRGVPGCGCTLLLAPPPQPAYSNGNEAARSASNSPVQIRLR